MIPKLAKLALVVALFDFVAGDLRGEVVESAPDGFVVQVSFDVARDRKVVYNAFVKGIRQWWESAHTFFGDAGNLSIEDRVGGCFCEKAKGGRGVRHLQVVYVDPGSSIRLLGGLGPLQEHAVDGSLTVSFEEAGSGTRLQLSYRVGGYVPGGLDKWASAVDSVLTTQMTRLKNYVETGKP